jgi:hypothetical protein
MAALVMLGRSAARMVEWVRNALLSSPGPGWLAKGDAVAWCSTIKTAALRPATEQSKAGFLFQPRAGHNSPMQQVLRGSVQMLPVDNSGASPWHHLLFANLAFRPF